jgi:hypothetical protein
MAVNTGELDSVVNTGSIPVSPTDKPPVPSGGFFVGRHRHHTESVAFRRRSCQPEWGYRSGGECSSLEEEVRHEHTDVVAAPPVTLAPLSRRPDVPGAPAAQFTRFRRRSTDTPALVPAPVAALPVAQTVPRRGVSASRHLPPEDWDRLLVTDARGLPTLYLAPHGGELVLTEPSTGRAVALSNRHLRGLGIWSIWLRNVDPRTIVAREGLLQPGSFVWLVREQQSGPGPRAIAVHAATGRPVGHVSTRIAAGLSPLIDGAADLLTVTLACDPPFSPDRPGLVKVISGTPEVIGHLFRRLPQGPPVLPQPRDTVLVA